MESFETAAEAVESGDGALVQAELALLEAGRLSAIDGPELPRIMRATQRAMAEVRRSDGVIGDSPRPGRLHETPWRRRPGRTRWGSAAS